MGEKTGYYLIVCGTSKYKFQYRALPSVNADIETVVNLFTQNFGYKQVLTELQLNPKGADLTNKFANWLQDKDRHETDVVIFYYSGHGEYVQGDRHYLVMEDTDPKKFGQTALPTEDLVRPLINKGVKISQILYIIDTCNSGSGAIDVTKFAASVIQQYQPVEKEVNIAVHAMAACRAKQEAQESAFSKALADAVEKLSKNVTLTPLGYIYPNDLVQEIKQNIPSQEQHVQYSIAGTETSANFFPILLKNLQQWEKKRHKFIEEFLCILNQSLESSLFFINSFILSRQLNEKFVVDEQDLKEKLKNLAINPVSQDGICPLIAYAEWCRLRFKDKDKNDKLALAQKIEDWQLQVIQCRRGVDLNKIKEFVDQSFDEFKKLIKEGNLRIQIEIEPEVNVREGTGKETGLFLLNMNLWIESQDLPLGRFAESLLLTSQEIEQNDGRKSETLLSRLEKDDLLSNLIRKARYSLPESVRLTIEIFLPFGYYQESLENICFSRGTRRERLGKEYPIFINSFERYFDQDFREIRDEIYENKKALWNNNDNHLDSKISHIGKKPSKSDLEMIEESKAIAIWSRSASKKPPVADNDLEWKTWPLKIHELRKQKKDPQITLFWDDLYPKPSRRCRPLDIKVVK